MDESLIINVWETFKDYIPEKSREAAADQFVDLLFNIDVDIDVFESLLGYDADLDKSIEVVLENHNEEIDDEDELDEDQDEDY
jgi:hypothetical protein